MLSKFGKWNDRNTNNRTRKRRARRAAKPLARVFIASAVLAGKNRDSGVQTSFRRVFFAAMPIMLFAWAKSVTETGNKYTGESKRESFVGDQHPENIRLYAFAISRKHVLLKRPQTHIDVTNWSSCRKKRTRRVEAERQWRRSASGGGAPVEAERQRRRNAAVLFFLCSSWKYVLLKVCSW